MLTSVLLKMDDVGTHSMLFMSSSIIAPADTTSLLGTVNSQASAAYS